MDGIDERRTTLSVDGDEVSVRYLTGGSGPPLVCCHGIGLDAADVSWRHALPALAADHTVYALDFPGHGGSDKPRREYTTDYYVDVLGAFIERLDLAGAALVGISMGGAVALGYALDGGDPRRLVLVDSYGLGGDAVWRSAAGTALRVPFADGWLWNGLSTRAGVRASLRGLAGPDLPEDLVADVRASLSRETVRALRSWQRHEFRADGLRTDYRERLEEVSAPTLLVHGAADPLFPVAWSEGASQALPEAELAVFENCGHWPPRERPARFNRVVGRALE